MEFSLNPTVYQDIEKRHAEQWAKEKNIKGFKFDRAGFRYALGHDKKFWYRLTFSRAERRKSRYILDYKYPILNIPHQKVTRVIKIINHILSEMGLDSYSPSVQFSRDIYYITITLSSDYKNVIFKRKGSLVHIKMTPEDEKTAQKIINAITKIFSDSYKILSIGKQAMPWGEDEAKTAFYIEADLTPRSIK